MRKFLFALSAAVLLAGCSRNAKLTVENKSASTLTNVVASGTGYSASIASLAPGAQQQTAVTVPRRANAQLKLDFDADGKHFSSTQSEDHSWKGMKETILTVGEDFSVSQSAVTSF